MPEGIPGNMYRKISKLSFLSVIANRMAKKESVTLTLAGDQGKRCEK